MKLPIYFHKLGKEDFPRLMELWKACEEIDVKQSETPEAYKRFLARNPFTNFAAYAGTQMVGAVLVGHDGWRGYLYHMAVAPDQRRRGIAKQLIKTAIASLKKQGIDRIHCLVKKDSLQAKTFWQSCDFIEREELTDFCITK